MSSRDYALYGDALNRLAGKTIDAGLATNSIKLLFDPADHRSRYVWVDPPWVLERGGAVVASGRDYPEPTEPDYRLKQETWCGRVKALLDGRELQAATAAPDGTVNVRLSGDLNLYDDWYVKRDDA